MSAKDNAEKHGVYGQPDQNLTSIPENAVQCSPLIPGSAALEEAPEGSLTTITIAAPPGTKERIHVLGLALRALKPSGKLVAIAPKKLGGQRLESDLEKLGATPAITSKAHQKIATCIRPADLTSIISIIEEHGPRLDEDLGLWTRPGIFSWDRFDPGTVALMENLPELSGKGADLGCGLGVLAHGVLQYEAVSSLLMVDIDRRAIEMTWRNVGDARISVRWEDAAHGLKDVSGLDFVVMNPPFHASGIEDKNLGQNFIATAARLLKKSGKLFMVANRHLPYEAVLDAEFKSWDTIAEVQGFKIIEARR